MPSYFLAWKYLCARRGQTAIMLAGMTLALYLPLATHWLVDRFDRDIRARAEATPLVIGAKGSRFDLVLHSLYFRSRVDGTVPYGEVRALRDAKLGKVYPLHGKFTARNQRVIGTTPEYLNFRQLPLAQGKSLQHMGDCVLGAVAAQQLGLQPGGRLRTDRDNLFDLAGEYPVQLNVVGILAPVGTADDEAVFVDIKTAWTIAGIYHGHDGNETHDTSQKFVKKYLEFTESNRDSFHAHGDPNEFPLTAIVLAPTDAKAMALALNHYQANEKLQALKPPIVVGELMSTVTRVVQMLDANFMLMAVGTGFLMTLIVLLSRRLRAREMETLFLLGCDRQTQLAMQAAELAILFAAAASLASLAAWFTAVWAGDRLLTLAA